MLAFLSPLHRAKGDVIRLIGQFFLRPSLCQAQVSDGLSVGINALQSTGPPLFRHCDFHVTNLAQFIRHVYDNDPPLLLKAPPSRRQKSQNFVSYAPARFSSSWRD